MKSGQGGPGDRTNEQGNSTISQRTRLLDNAAITLTQITSYKPQKLTKCYFLGDDGKPQAETSASMTEGQAEIVELSNLGEFSKLLASLGYNQAFVLVFRNNRR